MTIEEERDEYRRRAESAEGLLGFTLLALRQASSENYPVVITKELVDMGLPHGAQVKVDTDDPNKLVIRLTTVGVV